MAEIDEIQRAIAALEAQRAVLGDAVVETALAPLRQKLANLRQLAGGGIEQRKLVTILFADLEGFTALSERLDPEDTREILNDYFQRWSAIIERHRGKVEKFIGDAVMGVFGMLTAREGDPESAIRAAREMGEQLVALNRDLQTRRGVQLTMRVGVHTGSVVVSTLGERDGQEFVVVGDAVNLTSRLQSEAPPGGILISHDTYRHVRGVFEVKALEPLSVKGKSRPVQAYLVIDEKPEGLHPAPPGLEGKQTALVGRQKEMLSLQAAFWAAVEQGRTQFITILGEPGVGKSRLLEEFNSWLESEAQKIPLLLRARATWSMEQVPYALLKELFSDQFNIRKSDPADVVRLKVEEGLSPFLAEDAQSKSHFVAALAGFDLSESPYLLGVKNDARQFSDRALLYLFQFFDALLARLPVVILLDDIHWADDPSLEIILKMAEKFPDRKLMIVCLARRRLLERHAGWASPGKATHAEHLHITLDPLSQEHSWQLLEEFLPGFTELPKELSDKIIDSAQGNPFYLEELVQVLVEEGTIVQAGPSGSWKLPGSAPAELHIPPTLTALLQARLDGLPALQRVTLQQASVAGRSFWDALLQAVAQAEELPKAELEALCRRDLVLPQVPSSFEDIREFQFKHAILRDVAYETLLKRDRKVYHGRIADWLEAMTGLKGREIEFQALIAEHCDQAGQALRAANWYIQAGERARDIGASQQARLFFEKAAALIPQAEREHRWRLLLGWGEVLTILGEQAQRRAVLEEMLALTEHMDQDRQAEAYYRYGYYLEGAGEGQAALEALNRAQEAANSAGNSLLEAMVLALLAIQHSRQGQIELALGEAGQARQCLVPASNTDPFLVGMVLLNLSITYMTAGDLEQAYRINREQAELAHQLGNLRGEAYALNNMGYCLAQLGRFAQACTDVEESLRISHSIGDRISAAYAGLNLGLGLWRSDDLEEATRVLRPARAELELLGDTFGQAAGCFYQGLVEESAGNAGAAHQAFGEALGRLQGLGMVGLEADVYTGLARTALQSGDVSAAKERAETVWDYLARQGGGGLEFPILAYLTCARTFGAAGEQEAEARVIQSGYQNLIKRADLISDPDWRKTYLDSFPEHRALVERWAVLQDAIIS